jgi:hypothetical protein
VNWFLQNVSDETISPAEEAIFGGCEDALKRSPVKLPCIDQTVELGHVDISHIDLPRVLQGALGRDSKAPVGWLIRNMPRRIAAPYVVPLSERKYCNCALPSDR